MVLAILTVNVGASNMATFSPRFPKSEFGDFPDQYDENAAYFSRVLGHASIFLGPMTITSFYRPGDPRSHGQAAGVDFVPHRVSRDFAHAWLAMANYTAKIWTGRPIFGELINEPPRRDRGETTGHIHGTLPGVGGDGEVLLETSEGEYEPGFRYENVIVPTLAVWALLK